MGYLSSVQISIGLRPYMVPTGSEMRVPLNCMFGGVSEEGQTPVVGCLCRNTIESCL